MRGASLMRYTYSETEAFRHGASFLAVLLLLLIFFGGYFSGQINWWWMGFFTLWMFWKTCKFLGNDQIAKNKSFEKVIITAVSTFLTLFFLLIFVFGYKMGPSRHWWAGLPFIFVYFILIRFIHKPRKKMIKK